MANRQAATRASQEQYFYEYVDQLDRHRVGRMAMVVTLSGIDTARARQSTQNLVCDHIRQHMGAKTFQLFVFDRGDVAILTKDTSAGFLQDMGFGLVFQLKDEAFFQNFENGESDLCRLMDVEVEYKDLKSYAKAGLHKGGIALPGAPTVVAVQVEKTEDVAPPVVSAKKIPEAHTKVSPNDPHEDNMSTTYVEIDFGRHDDREEQDPKAALQTYRHEIIQASGGSRSEIAMSLFGADQDALTERFLEKADEETASAYLPGILQEAEQQLLSRLATDDPHLLPTNIAVAVQVRTLLSAAFLSFDQMRAELKQIPRSLLVVDRKDVRSHGDTFKFVREFVEGRGHQIGIRGLKLLSVGKLRLKASGFVVQFVEWNGFEASMITKKESQVLRAGVEDEGSAATVLTGCDEAEAIDFGRSIGITLFEGRAAAQSLSL